MLGRNLDILKYFSVYRSLIWLLIQFAWSVRPFFWKKKIRKPPVLSSAEFSQRVLKVKVLFFSLQNCIDMQQGSWNCCSFGLKPIFCELDWIWQFFTREITSCTLSRFKKEVYTRELQDRFGLGGSGGRGFNPHRGWQHSFVEIDHEIFSTVILYLPLIQEGQLSVSGERMCTILVNRLED